MKEWDSSIMNKPKEKGGCVIKMSREIWEIVQNMEAEDMELQLALQCAPLITGLKISNLLNIPKAGFERVKEIVEKGNISCLLLFAEEDKAVVLLYRKSSLEEYLKQERVKELLRRAGYRRLSPAGVLITFRDRYRQYMREKKDFPHEMGVLLGYPVEDVEGFMEHKGRNCLCTGYWKVYVDREGKQQIFKRFEYAKENLIQLLSLGVRMADIIAVCSNS